VLEDKLKAKPQVNEIKKLWGTVKLEGEARHIKSLSLWSDF